MVKKSTTAKIFLMACLVFSSIAEANKGKKNERDEGIENTAQRKKAAIESLQKKQRAAEKKAAEEKRKAYLNDVKADLLSRFNDEKDSPNLESISHVDYKEAPPTPVFQDRMKRKKIMEDSTSSTL